MADIKFVPILPKVAKLIDERRLQRELHGALDHTANIIRDDFQNTVKTWNNKPTFRKEGPKQTVNNLEATISTQHEVYTYVTRGTRKNYPIPKNPGRRKLRFRSGYRAKTRPRVIGSRGGGAFGGIRFARQVIHPGIEARDFDKEIARRRQRNHENLIKLAVRRSVRLT